MRSIVYVLVEGEASKDDQDVSHGLFIVSFRDPDLTWNTYYLS